MTGLKVTIPLNQLEMVADQLGSQGVDVCPDGVACWRKRAPEAARIHFLPDNSTNECRNCWMHYLVRGE